MVTTTFDTRAPAYTARSIPIRIGTALGRLMADIARLSAAAGAARYAGELAQLSDDQLAARGLTRDGIVAHAFRHLTWR